MSLEKAGKKIALLLSGHLRSISYTIDNIIQLKKFLNCDVFVHTWTTMESNSLSWRQNNYIYQDFQKNKLLVDLSPVGFFFEEQNTESIQNYFNISDEIDSKYFGMFAMCYGMSRCFDIFETYCYENNQTYDICLRHRFDTIVNVSDLEIQLSKISIFNGTVLMPRHNWVFTSGVHFDGLMIITPSDYKYFLNYLKLYLHPLLLSISKGERYLPELILCHSIRNCKLAIRPLKSRISLVRGNGYIEQEYIFKKSISDYFYSQVNSIKLFKFVTQNMTETNSYIEWKRNNITLVRWLLYNFYNVYFKIFK